MKHYLYFRNLGVLAFSTAMFACLTAGAHQLLAQAAPAPKPAVIQHAPVSTQRAPMATIPVSMAVSEPQVRLAWRKSMAKTAAPKAGCFKASYPSTAWQATTCTQAPNHPYPPARGPRPSTVGNGNDFSAQVSGLLTSAEGSFPSVTGVTSDTDPSGQSNFSLQLNTSFFHTTVCPAGSAGCLGWQQFIYSNMGTAFMQYWLLNYGAACPAGWNTYSGDCWRNGVNAQAVPVQPVSNLGNLTVTANAASGGNDSVVFSDGANVYSATGADSLLNLSQGWNTAEYNLVGDCCSTESTFNAGSTIIVRTSVDNGTTNPPSCVQEGFTGETNSLTMTPAQPPAPSSPPVCCPYGGASPSIEFAQSNNPTEWASCGSSIIVGDPHVTTADGTVYNFQGAGEFVALQDADGTVVQTRETPLVTGAPLNQPPQSSKLEWDNGIATCVSMNTAVAARVGTHRVTYEPAFGGTYDTGALQLRIDGKISTLNAQGINLGSGGRVINSSSGAGAIEIDFPDGKVLTVVPGTYDSMKYLNVDFSSLGVVSNNSGASEGGLAGVVPNGSWLPTLPSGASVGAIPADLHTRFETLYNTFGNAWRVASNASLFDYAPGTSTATFTAANWPVENATSCSLPTMKATANMKMARMKVAAPISAADAETACRLVTDATMHSSCVFDVTATGHGNLAETYAISQRVHLALKAPLVLVVKPQLLDNKPLQ
jgi:hypothetical protein